ncbi:hypothetical protein GCM10023213_33240 [Prosthecobacter algae]|uniref:Uncharacterized protein n=1 Tax=Prosthecobacter algae TaxID=1144682 RepID=A0ABP9PBK3_9BACT
MSSSYDPNRQRIDARPRNVYHTPEGKRVVGPTSAEISAQTSQRQYRGGPLYESRPLTQGGGLDGYYAMQKGGRPRPQSQVRERPSAPQAPALPPAKIETAKDGSRTLTSPYGKGSSTPGQPGVKPAGDPRLRAEIDEMKKRHSHNIFGSQAGRLASEPKRDVPATIQAGTIQADTAAAFKKELPPREIIGGGGSAVPNPVPVPKSLEPKGEAAGMGTLQAEPGAAFKKELPPMDLGLPPLMRNSYSHLAQPPARTKKTLLA